MRYITLAFSLLILALSANAVELAPEDCVTRVCITHYDQDHEEYLKRVLTAMDLSYSVKTKEGRNVVIWKSVNRKQEEEVHARVSQYFFVRDICPDLPLPTPDEPANPDIWCEQ